MRDTNDWLFLNSLIYKIYTTEDFDKMRYQFLEQIKIIIDFDSADFYLAKQDSDGNVCMGYPIGLNCNTLDAIKYDSIDYSRGILYGGRSMVYRETDIMEDERRVETDYYKNLYVPNKWHYSMQMVFARKTKFCGCITLYRNKGKENFSYEDVMLLDMLKEHMSFRIHNELGKMVAGKNKMTVTQAVATYGLTKREDEITRLLLMGKSNDEIRIELVISPNTLKKHFENIYKKLGINKKNQLLTQLTIE